MPTLTPLISSIAEARKALESGDRQLAEKAVREMCEVHQRDFNVTDEKDYTPELTNLQRFSVLEDWYAEILKGCKDYPSQIPYLFWMSVVWRMAVGEMGMVLDGQHQEKLRRVPDRCLALKREDIILKNSKLGHCAYSLYVADDTRDEDLAFTGHTGKPNHIRH